MKNGEMATLLLPASSRSTTTGLTRGKATTLGFLAGGVSLIWFSHSTIGSLNLELGTDVVQSTIFKETPNINCIGEMSSAVAATPDEEGWVEYIQTNGTLSNLWYGWQPKIPAAANCSWRECFKPDHECQTCRDMKKDHGKPPIPCSQWVPDVTMLHRMMLEGKDANGSPWPPKLDDELCEPIGDDGGRKDLDGEALRATEVIAQPMVSEQASKGPTILCAIYTMEENHASNIRAIRETWGGGCDGFLAFSTKSDPRIPAISIPHDGREEYNNMWQKVRSIWRFLGQHYLEDFDYFFMGGEDMYVIPQNLRTYLRSLGNSSEELHFVGRRFKEINLKTYFNSGGSGYALSRGIFRKFFNEGLDHPKCHPKMTTAMEDVMVADCLQVVFGVGLTNTQDEQNRERFHPFAPGTHYNLKPNDINWYEKINVEWGISYGKDCCAPDSVSYHYIKKPASVRHIHALLYQCSRNTTSNSI